MTRINKKFTTNNVQSVTWAFRSRRLALFAYHRPRCLCL